MGACALVGCDLLDDDVGWERFNAPSDTLVVAITAEASPGEPVSATLRSSTGAFVVGEATVTPGSGPVGTEHRVVVQVAADYRDVVGRVTVRAESPGRGSERFELQRDSAEPGYWERVITSSGVEGEVRDDTLHIGLWREVEDPEPSDTAAEAR